MAGKILLFGLGDLGGWALEFLARSESVRNILVVDINDDMAVRKIFNAKAGAAYMERFPNIEFKHIDVNNVDETAETIVNYQPDILVNFTTLQSWHVVGELPWDILKELERNAGLGPWIPMHLKLIKRIMEALMETGLRIPVVNASFPDAVNAILGKLGMVPTVGIGNSDCMIPGIKFIVAKEFDVRPNNVSVYLVAHHCHEVLLSFTKSTCGCPYFLRVRIGDTDVTRHFDPEELLFKAIEMEPEGAASHPMVAASAIKNVLAIMNDSGLLTHAPGPNGLIGGYDVRLSAAGADVVLPEGLTLDDAVKINEEAQKGDGIERIESDGTVVFTDRAYHVMKKLLSYDCQRLRPDEIDKRANELQGLYDQFRKKHVRV